MQKNIIVPIDFSEVSREVVKIADEWGQRSSADLYFLYASEPLTTDKGMKVMKKPLFSEEEESESGKEYHRQLNQFLEPLDLQSNYRTMHGIGAPYLQILEAEKMLKADLIIMAAHDHTVIGRILLGSNTDYVSHHSRCPLYIHRASNTEFENIILVPLDYTDVNKPVVEFADEWALRMGAELAFIHVDPVGALELSRLQREMVNPGDIPTLDMQLNHFVQALGVKSDYNSYTLGTGKPYSEILKLQKMLQARLIMMAAHSHTLAERWFKGSNTDYLLHHATCPMYVYKEESK